MTRVLCIVSSLDTGGAETFMMKLFRKLPVEYKLDFIVSTSSGFYEEEVKRLGGKIYRIPLRTQKPISVFKEIRKVVKNNNYNIVLKLCDTPIGLFDLLAAKAGGARKLCVRSCNSNSSVSDIKKLALRILQPIFNMVANVKIAPSYMAAEYTFGKRQVSKGKVQILHNGIDLDIYKYDENKRYEIRKEFDISEDTFVVCHVGRFNKQKNHKYLIQVFEEIAKQHIDSKMLLVGNGEEEDYIHKIVNEKQLSDKVIFAGIRSDVPAILSAADVMVFPSLYEGMPNTVIEAQATGLPCIVADSITMEAKLSDFVQYLSLNDSASKWGEMALTMKNVDRMSTQNTIIKSGYGIEFCVQQFVGILNK